MADVDGGDLRELEEFVGGMLKSLEPAALRGLLRRVSRQMRTSNQKRIAAQRNPDGSAFAKRKPPTEPKPGNHALKFLYPSGGSGAPRLVYLKSWEKQGPIFTGYDREAGGIRSFEYAKVIKYLSLSPGEENAGAGKIRNRSTIRQRAMFRKIRRAGSFNAGATDYEAWVGFGGMVAHVARIHQFGLRDRPARHAREVRYDKRELLGMTAADREELLDAVIKHMLPDH